MKAALTLDDLPHWAGYPYPSAHSPFSVARTMIEAFARRNLTGIYAFSNSRPFVEEPSLAAIMDDWVSAGHHVGNHTHSHPILHLTDHGEYMADIDLADKHLAPWLGKACGRFFRYTWNIRGETEEKRVAVKTHIAKRGYRPTECSSWFFEWDWDAAYIKCLDQNDLDGIEFLRSSFVPFAIRQLEHDEAGMQRVFGRQVPHILLLHNVSFLELVLDDFLDALEEAGVEFIPLEQADADSAYEPAGDFPCGEFLIYWRKLLWRDGVESDEVPPDQLETYRRVLRIAET